MKPEKISVYISSKEKKDELNKIMKELLDCSLSTFLAAITVYPLDIITPEAKNICREIGIKRRKAASALGVQARLHKKQK